MRQRRQFPRHAVGIEAALASRGRTAAGRVRDVSCGGARVDTAAAWAPGSAVVLSWAGPGRAPHLPLEGAVVWSRREALGLSWNAPLPLEIPAWNLDAGDWSSSLGLEPPSPELVFRTPAPDRDPSFTPGPQDEGLLSCTLAIAAAITRADRAGLQILDRAGRTHHPWCDWHGRGAVPAPCPDLQDFPWLAASLRQGRPVVWCGPADLPPEACRDRESLARHGIQARLALPLSDEEGLQGALLLDVLQAPRDWPADILGRLEPATRMLALALAHARLRWSLHQTSRFWESLIDTFPHPVFFKDIAGRYRGGNAAFARLILGVPKSRVARLSFFDSPKEVPYPLTGIYHQMDRALLQDGRPRDYEAQVRCADGVRREFLITKAVYLDGQGSAAGILGVMLDITRRKQTETELRQSELRYRRLFEDAVMGIFQVTLRGHPISVNPALARMFGYASPGELLAAVNDMGTELYADPADRRRNVARILESDAPARGEILFRRRDGSVFIGDYHGWKVRDPQGRLLYLEGFIEDVSARKQAEQRQRDSEERLRFLSARLLAAQETESRRIALDIHDDLGQNLAALKLMVQSATRRLRKDQAALKAECGRILELIDQVIEKARQLTRDLTPSVLDDLKLGGTLQWMAHDMGQRAGLQVELDMDDIDDLFHRDAQVVIYRIVQEALRNAIKHADAGRLALQIRREPHEVRCVVADDGRGFLAEAAGCGPATERGMGLAAMDERARMLGGVLTIDSRPGRGTRVIVVIPAADPGACP